MDGCRNLAEVVRTGRNHAPAAGVAARQRFGAGQAYAFAEGPQCRIFFESMDAPAGSRQAPVVLGKK